ncbi:hypothetical protein [endosymbiont of Lamellibrachia barhami]|uniref:hypothetical protein n=1 Tax=endosymbiont of Lamellibrachia barhami TaxID=205975 RepID=UPI0015A8BAA6|nr:hypothetical protein [endosymbiont of Lamellibrachia barhami]
MLIKKSLTFAVIMLISLSAGAAEVIYSDGADITVDGVSTGVTYSGYEHASFDQVNLNSYATALVQPTAALDSRYYDYAVLRFNDLFGPAAGQIAAGDVISSATISFDIYQTGSQVYLGAVNADGSTWAASPSLIKEDTGGAANAQYVPTNFIGTFGSEYSPIGTYSFDITSLVADWRAAPATNAGLVLYTRFGERVDWGPWFAGLTRLTPGVLTITTGPTNTPPTADFAFEQLSNIGNTALLRLDGTGSFDPDAGDVLTFQWTVDGMADCVGNLALCGVIDIPLGFGAHDVALTVTDPEGASDETTKTVTLNPAELAVLEIDKSKVKFTENSYVKFHGEIGLPFGEDYTTLSAEAVADIYVAGVEILPPTTVAFMPEVGADEWEYEGNEATNGISKFKIDWKGARYRFKESDYPIKMKSHIIAPTETVLTIKYKMKDIGGAFPIDIDGRALIDVDASGGATTVTAGVLIEVEETGKEITLTLPFPLLDTSIITIGTLGDSVYRVLYVVEGLKGSIGRFELEANFDASPFPAGATTLPRTIELDIDVGAQRYFGSASLGESELSVKKDKWRSK